MREFFISLLGAVLVIVSISAVIDFIRHFPYSLIFVVCVFLVGKGILAIILSSHE